MPGVPPPLPQEQPTSGPIPYATPIPGRGFGRPKFHFGIFLWSLALVGGWMILLFFILPRFQQVFADFKVELPASTKILLQARTLVQYGGFVVLLAIPVILGFVSGPLSPGSRRALRMVVTLLFALVVVLSVLGIFQPLMSLIDAASSSGKR